MIDDHLLRVERWMPSTFTCYIAAVCAFATVLVFSKKRLAFIEHCNQIPGPPAPIPLIGNALELPRNPDGMCNSKKIYFVLEKFRKNQKTIDQMKEKFLFWRVIYDWAKSFEILNKKYFHVIIRNDASWNCKF